MNITSASCLTRHHQYHYNNVSCVRDSEFNLLMINLNALVPIANIVMMTRHNVIATSHLGANLVTPT